MQQLGCITDFCKKTLHLIFSKLCKAFNAAWNVQPENVNYNAHGCCVNHWYRVPITLDPKITDDIKSTEGEFGNVPSGGKFTKPFRNLDHPDTLRQREAAGEVKAL